MQVPICRVLISTPQRCVRRRLDVRAVAVLLPALWDARFRLAIDCDLEFVDCDAEKERENEAAIARPFKFST